MKEIRVYHNKDYLFTTTQYRTIKQLKATMQEGKTITIASLPTDKQHTIDRIKNYAFEIVK